MSLGYSSQKPVRTTNMPGAIGNMMVRSSARRSPASRVASSLMRVTSSSSPPLVVEKTEPTRKLAAKVSQTIPFPPSSLEATGEHWVYATASHDLFDDQNIRFAAKGERVLLVYPQKYDKDTGKVSMRAKVAHKDTGQLRHIWTDVYSGPDEDTRSVHSFSLVP